MARPANLKHRGPQQKSVLDGDVILLRKIDITKIGGGVYDKIRNASLRQGELEGDQPWFLENYVAGEQPRDAMVSRAIMQATTGFAIARTDSGEILTKFGKNDVVRAEDATHSARITLAVDVELDADEAE